MHPLSELERMENDIRDLFVSHGDRMSFEDAETLKQNSPDARKAWDQLARDGYFEKKSGYYVWRG